MGIKASSHCSLRQILHYIYNIILNIAIIYIWQLTNYKLILYTVSLDTQDITNALCIPMPSKGTVL